jgi:hypothetical protein
MSVTGRSVATWFMSVQLISVPVCIGPPLGVALRRGPETYETAALPLSYVGADQG